jgi:DNA ligase-1
VQVRKSKKGVWSISQGIMKYKEIRPREVEKSREVLRKYCGDYYMSEKYDGWQAIWDGKSKLLTKTGKRMFAPPSSWYKLLPKDIPIAGELIIKGKSAPEVASLLKESDNWKKAEFRAFDIPDNLNFFKFRTQELKKLVKQQCAKYSGTCPLKYVDQKIAKNPTEIYQFWKKVLDKGGEGIILTKMTSLYISGGKRTDDRVKLKGRQDMEGVIQDFNIVDGKMKSMVVKLSGSQTFKLGIGFSQEERENFQREFKIGAKVKFSFRDLTPGGIPKEARFVGKRHASDL